MLTRGQEAPSGIVAGNRALSSVQGQPVLPEGGRQLTQDWVSRMRHPQIRRTRSLRGPLVLKADSPTKPCNPAA